jgi:outer membrane protein assembly factor BamE (lipoprotein component of BamABCDE complex)
MRRFLVILPTAALVTLALAGCATLTASAHIERGVNFGDYITYDWGPPDNLPVGDPRLDNNPFVHDYLEGAAGR